jgi:tetratricopeptide (TPR) repeat protein
MTADAVRIEYEKAVDLFGHGKKEEAAAALRELIAKNPDHADAHESLGMVYYKMDRLDEAIEWTERLAKLRPDHAMAHTNLSVFYMKKGMKERAEEEKAKAVVLNFSNPKPKS